MSAAWCRAKAPAKVNLALRVLGKREDGFHEIATRMAAIDLSDAVAVRRSAAPGVRLHVSGPAATPDVPRDESNLVVRALEAFLARVGVGGGLDVRLEKSIPSGGGLGGGSSDAAAALLAAAGATAVELPVEEELALLAGLGSDTVFFAAAGATGHALATGRGELVRALPPIEPAPWVALCTPAVPSPTGAVYATWSPERPSRAARVEIREDSPTDLRSLRDALENDLEPAAIAAVPVLGRWRELLDGPDLGAWRLSGSGSTWFGLYADERSARQALALCEARAGETDLAIRAMHAVPLVARARGPVTFVEEA